MRKIEPESFCKLLSVRPMLDRQLSLEPLPDLHRELPLMKKLRLVAAKRPTVLALIGGGKGVCEIILVARRSNGAASKATSYAIGIGGLVAKHII
jgi:hypothetical protein